MDVTYDSLILILLYIPQAFLESVYPSCHSPAKPPSRKSAPSSSSQSGPSSLGFQLHFADVFLEELAKVIGQEEEEEDDDSLPLDETIRSFLRPFTAVLREARDARLRGHVEERVFHHLMRQSDVGIAYDEVRKKLNSLRGKYLVFEFFVLTGRRRRGGRSGNRRGGKRGGG